MNSDLIIQQRTLQKEKLFCISLVYLKYNEAVVVK